jgi:hypothetical protein
MEQVCRLVVLLASAHPQMSLKIMGTRAILRKVKEIKGLRGGVQVVRRTSNPED